MTRWVFFLLLLASCLDSCSTSQDSHWISRSELRPASQANIKSIELKDGAILEFNSSLGWYDEEKQVIEGVNRAGGYDTTSLAKVQSVEIVEGSSSGSGNSALTTIFVVLGVIFVCVIVLGIIIGAAYNGNGSGCLVLIQLGIASAATMAAVAILIFV